MKQSHAKSPLQQSDGVESGLGGKGGGSGTRRGNFIASVSIKSSMPDNCAASDIAAEGIIL